MQKVRFTLWMDEEVLKAAKRRAAEEGATPSRVIAAAARTMLIDNPQNAEARVLQAVERLLALIQRIDRRRSYDQQVLKEMVGLMVQSFFNHTPAIPEKDKKAALHSGKARFNRFLDALASNLRAGQSIMNDLPAPTEPAVQELAAPTPESGNAPDRKPGLLKTPEAELLPTCAVQDSPHSLPERPKEARQEKPESTGTRSRWSLFG
jgi:hypothetical protein